MSQCSARWLPFGPAGSVLYCIGGEGHKGPHQDNEGRRFSDTTDADRVYAKFKDWWAREGERESLACTRRGIALAAWRTASDVHAEESEK
jgi:hypothetical protein